VSDFSGFAIFDCDRILKILLTAAIARVDAVGDSKDFELAGGGSGVGHAQIIRIAYPFTRFILRIAHFIFRGSIHA
jgi:hypothetical protein